MIIAIDGASTDLSVALLEADGTPIGEDAWTSEQRQSSELLPRLLSLIDRHGRSLPETTALAVGTGPGSFTGLRVAMALAKGLAIALGRPIVGVPGLAAWLETEPDAVAALARAGAREAYVLLRDHDEPMLADRDRLHERLADRVVVAPSELASAFGLDEARFPRAATAIGRAAARRLAAGEPGDDLARLEPRYLRAPRGLEASQAEEAARWR
jgi:tRNA threonylcarbamoyladenosine biosynthesis protein TsaB